MTIYRLLECSGQYEDYHEYHIGTYSNYNRAREIKKKHEKLEEEAIKQARMCEDCECGCGTNPKCLGFKSLDNDEYECANWFSHWEDSTFKIEEEEVLD